MFISSTIRKYNLNSIKFTEYNFNSVEFTVIFLSFKMKPDFEQFKIQISNINVQHQTHKL